MNTNQNESDTDSTDPPEDEPLRLIAYVVAEDRGFELEPASFQRVWMDETPDRFAYRCLPLVVANQAGWIIRCPATFSAVWNGDPYPEGSIQFHSDDRENKPERLIRSHFGSGIVTFSIPYLFRTNKNVGLLVRGLPNSSKPNATPLEGFVETNWSPFTFTMNWKIDKPFEPITFERGEPICFLQPINVAMIEQTEPEVKSIEDNVALKEEYEQWREGRSAFIRAEDRGKRWQKDYFQGKDIHGNLTSDHRIKLTVKEFADSREEAEEGPETA